MTEVTEHPSLMFRLNKRKISPIINEKIKQRQKQSKIYVLNGALYFGKTEFYKKNNSFIDNETIGYVMPKERSIDIDDNNQ